MEMQLALAKDFGSVFHGTSFLNIAAIIKTDKLQLSQVAGKEAEAAFAKHPFFLSVRRNRVLTAQNFYDVTIEFKEQSLQSRMKRESVDYWGHVEGKGNSIEQEDRYYSAKPVLKNATKLIRAIHVDLSNYDAERRGKMMRELFVTALRLKIKVYLYKDKAAYANLNTHKTVPLSEMEYGGKVQNLFRTRTAEEATQEGEDQMYKGMRYARSVYPDIKFFVDILYGNTPPVNDKTKYLRERYGYRYGEHDLVTQFQNELHNASHSHGPKDKQLAARVQTWMRENNLGIKETAYRVRENIRKADGE
jgi:hypothetical protein